MPKRRCLYGRLVTEATARQLRVEMPDGLVIERLPLGLAHGRWRLSFVASGIDFSEGHPPRLVAFHQEFKDRVAVDGVGGTLENQGSSGGGGDDEQAFSMIFRQNGVSGLRITYLHEDRVFAREVVDLIP